jgi:tricorn protease
VRLTTSSAPSAQGATTTAVKTLTSEVAIRYREWVEARRALVEQASGGTLGYVHIPSMMESGLSEFARSYYAQTGRQGLIIDVRYNGGGFVADMIIDRLERQLWALTQPREGVAGRNPERVFHGPMVVLINSDSGSNAEFFAEAVKRKGLATVIGKRTWGGSIGIEPHQDLVDGGVTTPPQFGLYGLDRTWLIEGRGVEPDLVVENSPADELRDHDTQLLAAIELLQQQLQAQPVVIPPPPPYPDKSKPTP